MVCYIEKQRYDNYGAVLEADKRVYVECKTEQEAQNLRNFVRILNKHFSLDGEGYELRENVDEPIVEKI